MLFSSHLTPWPIQDVAGPAKRVKTFVATVHSMGLLPLKQMAPVTVAQPLPKPDSMLATGFGRLTEQQRLSSASGIPGTGRVALSTAPERLSTDKHTPVPLSTSQHIIDQQVGARNCLL